LLKKKRKPARSASSSQVISTRDQHAGGFLLLALLAVTFLVYLPALNGHFVNWDDPLYVTDSPWIRLSLENIKSLCSPFPGKVNLPLTRLSLSLNHAVSGFDPWSYHLINILLHLLNTALVYLLVRLVSQALNGKKAGEVALITAAFFGLHPLHVESVAWVAERKDVLYTAFFLGSLICYLRYVLQEKGGLFFLSLALFIFSLLSKAQAVTLPLILVALDWLVQRRTTIGRWLLEKGPFFAVSLVYGLWNLLLTKGLQAADPEFIDPSVHFTFWQRLFLTGYAFSHYLLKTIAPFKLSVIYPYPELTGGALSPFYSTYLIPIVGTIGLLGYLGRRYRVAAFAIWFFLINIVITFQTIIGITPSIMNDRYTYLASAGIFFLFALVFREALKRWGPLKRGIQLFFLVWMALLAVTSFERAKVWKDSLGLWNDVLFKYDRVSIARINRGEAKAALSDFEGALADFEQALAIDPKSSLAWANRGAARIKMGDFNRAMLDLEQAVLLNPAYGDAYLNRGTARISLGDIQGALQDFTKAVRLQPGSVKGWTNRGFTKIILGDPEGALADCNRALALAPEYGKALWGRGSARIRMGNRLEGCSDLKKAWNSGVGSAKLEFKEYCQN
jgi:protein O-mannosyl-transferase